MLMERFQFRLDVMATEAGWIRTLHCTAIESLGSLDVNFLDSPHISC